MTESAEKKAKRYAEHRRTHSASTQAGEIKQLNRQLRDPKYREELAAKVIKGGVL